MFFVIKKYENTYKIYKRSLDDVQIHYTDSSSWLENRVNISLAF